MPIIKYGETPKNLATFEPILGPPQRDEDNCGMWNAGPEVGMINIFTIVALKRPTWSIHQGPTEFVAITGERGWLRESYINLCANLKMGEEHNGWYHRAPAPLKLNDTSLKLKG